MKELINILGQQFYYSTIDQIIEKCSKKEKCAIIIDESFFDDFLAKAGSVIGECVDQIIIISEDVNSVLSQLEGVSVLLISAGSLEEAVKISILGADLSKEVVCIPKESEDKVKEIIEGLAG